MFGTNRKLFRGADNPMILVLEGIQWGGSARVHSMVIGSTWSFEADGTFVFYPANAADFRDDLYPISGTYSEGEGRISFRAVRRALLPAQVSLDGFIIFHGAESRAEFIHGVSSGGHARIAKVTLSLLQLPDASSDQFQGEAEFVDTPGIIAGSSGPSKPEAVSFSGMWQSDIFGDLQLDEKDSGVTGGYENRGGGRVQGTVTRGRLDFQWSDAQAGNGHGFLRAVSHGRFLAGLWWRGTDLSSAEVCLACRKRERPRGAVPPEAMPVDELELRHRGYDLHLEGRFEEAIEMLEAAHRLHAEGYLKAGASAESPRYALVNDFGCLTRLVDCYRSLGDDEAVRAAERRQQTVTSLLKELDTLRDFELRQRLLAANAAVYSFGLTDHQRVAAELAAISADYERLLRRGPGPLYGVEKYLNSEIGECDKLLAFLHSIRRKDAEARRLYEQAAESYARARNPDQAEWCRRQAEEIRQRNEFSVEDQLQRLLSRLEQEGVLSPQGRIETLLEVAELYFGNNDYFEAERLLRQAESELGQLDYGPPPDQREVAELMALAVSDFSLEGGERFRRLAWKVDQYQRLYRGLAQVHERMSHSSSAENRSCADEYRQRAQEMEPAAGEALVDSVLRTLPPALQTHLPGADEPVRAVNLVRLNLDLDEVNAENSRRADGAAREDLVERAADLLERARRVGNPEMVVSAGLCLARVLVAATRYDEAEAVLEQARQELGGVRQEDLGVYVLVELARIHAPRGDWARVSALCSQGIDRVETYRTRLTRPYLSSAYLQSRIALYSHGVRAAYELKQYDLMLERAELSKCRSVLRYRSAPVLPGREAAPELKELRYQLLQVGQEIDGASPGSDLEELVAKRRLLWEELFIRRFQTRTPDIIFDLPKIRAALSDNEAILYYYWLDKHNLLMATIDRMGLAAEIQEVPVERRKQIEQYADNVLRISSTRCVAFLEKVKAFADMLLPQPGRGRELLTDKQHLFLSPHRVLHGLPLHALPWGDGLLIEQFAVTYLPNLVNLQIPAPPLRLPRLLALGINQFKARKDDGGELTPLSNAEEEANEIGRLYQDAGSSTTVLVSAAAIKRKLLADEDGLQDVTYLHLATHGMDVKGDAPMDSELFLYDAKLTALEITDLPLTADLVILSACSSGQRAVKGRGLDELPGDDLFGLQAGFFAAGARGVVGSLWPVESKEAYKIMLAFHGGLLSGLPPARALQASVQRWLQAKCDEKRQKNPTTPFNPGQYVHHWAPFFLTALGHFPSLLSQGG